MKRFEILIRPALISFALVAPTSIAHSATLPVTDWVVHNTNGSITVTNANTNSPTFKAADVAADTMSIMAPFSAITLANDGDFIKLTTNLSMANRSTTGVNTLNTHLRFGLFDGPGSPVVASDAPNFGFLAQYANANQNHLQVFEQQTAAVDPINTSLTQIGSTTLGNVTADPENDSIQGANPTAAFEMTITRSGGKLNIAGQISGGSYLSTFNVVGYTSANFPSAGSFTFDRVGFFLGNNVNAQDGSTFNNVTVETNVVPEPAFCVLAATWLFGGLLLRRRGR
jgi:hypothetical protein